MRIRLLAALVMIGCPELAHSQAACPAGSTEIVSAAEALRPVCGRPVVNLNEAERAQVPVCGLTETLMRGDNGLIFRCIPTERVPANARPVCFNGTTPLNFGGESRCRHAAVDGPRVDLALTGNVKAFTAARGPLHDLFGAPNFEWAEQGASVRITVTNEGDRASVPTRLAMHFPPRFPYRNTFTFVQPCLVGLRPDRGVCVLSDENEAAATIGVLGRGAQCAVPALEPGATFRCFVGVRRIGKLPSFPRNDLVAFIEVSANVNDDRSQKERDFDNNRRTFNDRLWD